MKRAWLYSDLLQALKEKPLRSGLPTDGSLICASAALHFGDGTTTIIMMIIIIIIIIMIISLCVAQFPGASQGLATSISR